MPIVVFRADGGPAMGMGHVMRCLSLAGELKDKGCKTTFLSREKPGIDKIRENGFTAVELKTGNNIHDEILEVSGIIAQMDAEILVIDKYDVAQNYFICLNRYVKIIYIDDENKYPYPVDMLVNGNITGKYLEYRKGKADERFLLGPEYNLIRNEFHNMPRRIIEKKVKEIMITTGGSDPYDMSLKILDILLGTDEFKYMRINIVAGISFQNLKKLREAGDTHENVVLYENTARISEVMRRSDIAISSGGSTLYELCACGTPTAAFVMAENQRGIVDKLSEMGYIQSLGWFDGISKTVLEHMITDLYSDYEARMAYSQKMQQLVDGLGSRRVADAVLSLL